MNSGTFTKLIIAAIILLLLPASQASAADITTSATCTLENAWASAKANSNTGGCVASGAYGDDTIILHDNAVIAAAADLTLTNGSTITVNGNGYTIDAKNNDQHFATAAGATITLNNVKLTGGRNHQPSSITVADSGAASAININNSVICGNESTDTDATATGAIHVSLSQSLFIRNSIICNNTGAGWGGGLKNLGNATVINSVFYGNTASADGGAINTQAGGGSATILRHVTITKNRAPNGSGIFIRAGNLEIRNSIIHGNTDSHDCRIHSNHSGTVTASGVLVGTSTCGNKLTPVSTADPRLIDRTSAAYRPPRSAPHYALSADSPARAARAAAPCLTGDAAVPTDLLGRSRPTSGNCDLGAVVYVPPPAQQPASNGGGGGDSAAMAQPVVRVSPTETCAALSPGIMVSNASPGTACNRVDGSSIGHHAVAASGFRYAVDLWGWVTPDTKVCFRASSGSIRFIDTTVSPRTVATLPAFSSDGMLCGMIDRAGQVDLVPGPPAPPAASDAASEEAAQVIGKSLSDCMVRAKYSLNFRDAPAGAKIGGVPHNAVLTALARTPGWFKVDYHGAKGWIAAMYVEPMGLCG